jgi:hypothetical protein
MKMTAFRRDLANLRRTVREAAAPPPAPPAADETVPLAAELSGSFGDLVNSYQEAYALPREEAMARVSESFPAAEDRGRHAQPKDVQFYELNALAQRDPELARGRWEEIKEAARAELQSGYRAARVMEVVPDCWSRARFLALRDDIARDMAPRNGLEWQLIDMLAQAQTMIFWWQENLAGATMLAARRANRALKGLQEHEPRWLSHAEETAEAAAMVERWHGIYLRTLKALRDQRRYAPTVIVQQAGQVNVGGQQVNVAGG